MEKTFAKSLAVVALASALGLQITVVTPASKRRSSVKMHYVVKDDAGPNPQPTPDKCVYIAAIGDKHFGCMGLKRILEDDTFGRRRAPS